MYVYFIIWKRPLCSILYQIKDKNKSAKATFELNSRMSAFYYIPEIASGAISRKKKKKKKKKNIESWRMTLS